MERSYKPREWATMDEDNNDNKMVSAKVLDHPDEGRYVHLAGLTLAAYQLNWSRKSIDYLEDLARARAKGG